MAMSAVTSSLVASFEAIWRSKHLLISYRIFISANLFESTNHPLTDISILNPDGSVNEIQLKATDSASYINTTISENPEIELVTTSEAFESIDCENVIDSGISNADLNDAVVDNLFEDVVSPVSPLSGIGWLLGLPFKRVKEGS